MTRTVWKIDIKNTAPSDKVHLHTGNACHPCLGGFFIGFIMSMYNPNKKRSPLAECKKRSRMTKKQLYDEYMNSAEWKRRRKIVIDESGGRCEGCNRELPLQVHHITYEHFMNELRHELTALCEECHEIADRERERQNEINAMERQKQLENRRFEGWACKVYGDDWQEYKDPDCVYEEFQDWLERLDY